MVISNTIRDGKDCIDIRYYILSKKLSAKRFAAAVASHWAIENQLHWQLDVTFREDHCRIRKGHADTNFSTLRRTALSMLKNEKTKKLGIKNKRLSAGWDEHLGRYCRGIQRQGETDHQKSVRLPNARRHRIRVASCDGEPTRARIYPQNLLRKLQKGQRELTKKVGRVSVVRERVAFKCAHKRDSWRPNTLYRFLNRHTYSDTLNRPA